ncbi:MAG TPA: response regulator [Pyrinomonadaceae bacterium]|jgi:CheY-like chemotaxis protein|nr:response regulator [Pyrinomonadaceae bacterium]
MESNVSIRRGEGSPTILVVEDFDDTRLMMKMWLVKKGYRVLEAETGEEGVAMAQQERPDLIIMDMMMPGMNGLDATQCIRQDRALRRTPIVAVSAYGADEYRRIAIEAGCTEYVSTPFEPDGLAELIAALLNNEAPKDQTTSPGDRDH